MTNAQKKAIRKYKQKNIIRFTLELNRTTDADILKWLDIVPNMTGAIKAAIRERIKKENEVNEIPDSV